MQSFEQFLKSSLAIAGQAGLAIAREKVPVDTGRLRDTIRIEVVGPGSGSGESGSNQLTIRLVAGGDPNGSGVFVDYALDAELRQPFLAPGNAAIWASLQEQFRSAGLFL